MRIGLSTAHSVVEPSTLAKSVAMALVVLYAFITLVPLGWILLTSIKTPPFDLGQWRSQGIAPEKLSVIGVKAAVAHRRVYDPIAARMLWVDTPGPCRSDLRTFPYRNIRRPVWPLDG